MKPVSRFSILLLAAAALSIPIWLLYSRDHDQPASRHAENHQVTAPPVTEGAPAAPNLPPSPVPPEIVLHGTYIKDGAAAALISLDNEAQRWLNRQDLLNVDFYLAEIFKDYVIVRDTGNSIALEIRITNGGASQELPDVMPAVPAHAWVESQPPVPGIERVEPNRYRVRRELVMKELQSGEIFSQVRILPEESGGFSIDRIHRGSMAEVVGLRVGDTIHKINDRPLTNIMDVLDLYKNLESLEKIDVEISRMQEVQHLHYELN